jgi:tetratricopeptide (TPR) repeat protein
LKDMELNPEFEVAVIHLGNAYFQQGRYREAISQYQHYIRIASSDFDRGRGYAYVALVHRREGRFAEAEQVAKTAIKYNKTAVSALFLVALDQGDITTAEKLRKILEQKLFVERSTRGYFREFFYLRGRLTKRAGAQPKQWRTSKKRCATARLFGI